MDLVITILFIIQTIVISILLTDSIINFHIGEVTKAVKGLFISLLGILSQIFIVFLLIYLDLLVI